MPKFRLGLFLAMLGLAAFTLVFISVGLRWHTHRARASLYAQKEVDHTFKAADFARAARALATSEDDDDRADGARLRLYAALHARAARECTQLRERYEQSW